MSAPYVEQLLAPRAKKVLSGTAMIDAATRTNVRLDENATSVRSTGFRD